MALRLYNTLTREVEEFRPSQDNVVRMYNCGPTVYNFGHIGNFRTFVAVDILRRFLLQSGFKLKHVMNITDVDDRIIENSAKLGLSVRDYTKEYEDAFLEDSAWLNLQKPDFIARATEHIPTMAKFIADLEQKGIAYKTEDGSYYFRIAKFPQYGKLSKKDFSGMEVGARVDSDRFDKEEARDFALWKAPKPGEASWDTPIGPGRPGWHIECSAMSREYLGDAFDLHGGGEDLIFPHHENEIAQSEALTGKIFARHWFHVRFLLIEDEKMSKSLGNFFTLRDLMLMGHKPSSIRFVLASVPYRKQLNFTWDGLKAAASSLDRLRSFRNRLLHEAWPPGMNAEIANLAGATESRFTDGLNDDLNTAEALAAVFEMIREVNLRADRGEVRSQDVAHLMLVLRKFDDVFAVMEDTDTDKMRAAIEWAKAEGKDVSPEALAIAQSAGTSDADIDAQIAEMTAARKAKNFARSDEIRKQLNDAGILVEITKDGVRWRRK